MFALFLITLYWQSIHFSYGYKTYSEFNQTPEMKLLTESINDLKQLTTFGESSLLNNWLGSWVYLWDMNLGRTFQ